MAPGPEYTQVELPLLEQLVRLGWTHFDGAPNQAVTPTSPQASGRQGFAEVLLEGRLRDKLAAINRGPDGRPWLDEGRISQAVGELTRISTASLLEANQEATRLLLDGVTVEGLPGWNGGRDQRVHFIDWENPLRNDFVVVSQFRVDIPGTQGRKCIVPDEVLFVNGIPLVLIECKKPGSPIIEAIRQHLRYADRRVAPVPEGNQKLFVPTQFLIATNGGTALLGSITSDPTHYQPWRDPYPLTNAELAQKRRKHEDALTQQDILTEAVLHPARLLDIVRNYVTFKPSDDGKVIKALPRYHQYRTVDKAIGRLQNGATRKQDGSHDRRGGVIWHTQGSGKSLSMTFLVRKMRTVPGLKKTKVVIVTDRTDLQRQLSDTMTLAGEPVKVAKRIRKANQLLSEHGPGVVFVMIQKQQDESSRSDDDITDGNADLQEELNADESIVILIDEAHRSHSSALHAHLMAALPNAARIGFTGTPILMGKKKHTTDIFGSYIDIYRLADAELDKAVVPVFYAGRAVKGAVRDGGDLDEVFEDMTEEHTPQEMEQIKRRYATAGEVMEATELIEAKARNMLRHYVETVLPSRFKAQVVAHSRRAALRYRDAFLKARDELVTDIEKLPQAIRDAHPDGLPRKTAYLVGAAKHLDLLRAIDFIPVISAGTNNDEQDFEAWTDPARQELVIAEFKKPFPAPDTVQSGKLPVFLIVKSMLLTGFDAPVDQVLYLDRQMQGAELLQAIASVNRPAEGKNCGYVIDYAGVTRHLAKALKEYSAEDIAGDLKDLSAQVQCLDELRRRVRLVFASNNVQPVNTEDAVQLLADGPLRDQFEAELDAFASAVDTVLPLPTALSYLPALKLFAAIAAQARARYRDAGAFDPSLYGAKVRELIDQHMIALGITLMLPPVSITDHDYAKKVARMSPRARASEMEHAIRHHISVHLNEDPARYRRLSERLEQILAAHKDNWEQQALALGDLLEDMKNDGAERPGPGRTALNPVESALWRLLAEEVLTDGVLSEEQGERLAYFCGKLHAMAVRQITRTDFWRQPVSQHDFRDAITVEIINDDIWHADGAPALADKLFEIIKANSTRIRNSRYDA